ncbi:hypothetical protein [Flexivirga sp.]|uniref:hypothetical protein n=1 Tax=Flexivirga sp. TaxID=1962927 RepID=UPI003F803708
MLTSSAKRLFSEVPAGPANGLDHDCVIALDNVLTIPSHGLGRTIGFLHPRQEHDRAMP